MDTTCTDVLPHELDTHKYLGTIIEHKLTFQFNSEYLVSKCQQCLFLLRKLQKLQIHPSILGTFYKCFIESILSFNIYNKRIKNKGSLIATDVTDIPYSHYSLLPLGDSDLVLYKPQFDC